MIVRCPCQLYCEFGGGCYKGLCDVPKYHVDTDCEGCMRCIDIFGPKFGVNISQFNKHINKFDVVKKMLNG
jgi:hypothetical protein